MGRTDWRCPFTDQYKTLLDTYSMWPSQSYPTPYKHIAESEATTMDSATLCCTYFRSAFFIILHTSLPCMFIHCSTILLLEA
jgi:hypothetical protein